VPPPEQLRRDLRTPTSGPSISIPALDLVSRFDAWPGLSDKPMFVSEYGADAFDNNAVHEDQAAQAEATEILPMQIFDQPQRRRPGPPVPRRDDLRAHRRVVEGRRAPSTSTTTAGSPGAIHADGFANEEWWGLMDVQRTPRQAYTALQAIYMP
jgi:hypothetical protein